MRERICVGIIALAIAVFATGCVELSGDHAIVFEFDLGGVYATVLKISPTTSSTIEIEKGDYFFKGSLSKSSSSNAAGPALEAFPQYMYIRLVKVTPSAGSASNRDRATQTQDIKLKINPKTGEIDQQAIWIAKDMIVDPLKKEYVLLKTRVTGGSIKAGDHLWLTYWNNKVGRPGAAGR